MSKAPRRRTQGYKGSVELLASKVKALYPDISKRLTYSASWGDPADETWFEANTSGIHKIQEAAEMLNPSWLDFTKAVLFLQTENELDLSKKKTLGERRKIAEEEATIVRTVCRHVRRGWYRRTKSGIMTNFPLPSAFVASSGSSPTAAQAKADPSRPGTSNNHSAVRPLVRMSSMASDPADHSDDDVGILGTKSPETLIDIPSETDDEKPPEYTTVYEIIFNGVNAYRQLIVDGDKIGDPEPCVQIVSPEKAGQEYLAEFIDGERMHIPGYVFEKPPGTVNLNPSKSQPKKGQKRKKAEEAEEPVDEVETELQEEDPEEENEEENEDKEEEVGEDDFKGTAEHTKGTFGILQGLKTAELNGTLCRVIEPLDATSERVMVQQIDLKRGDVIRVRSENLACFPEPDFVSQESLQNLLKITDPKGVYKVSYLKQGVRSPIVALLEIKAGSQKAKQLVQIAMSAAPVMQAFSALGFVGRKVIAGEIDASSKAELKAEKEKCLKAVMDGNEVSL